MTAKSCTTHHACDCITERNRQLETALRELVEAGSLLESASDQFEAWTNFSHTKTAANNLLATPKGEDDE